MIINKDVCRKAIVKSKVMQGRRIGDALKALLNGKNLSIERAITLHNGILVSTLNYEFEILIVIGPVSYKGRTG